MRHTQPRRPWLFDLARHEDPPPVPGPSGDPAPPAPDPAPDPAPEPDPQNVADLPEWAQKSLRDARADAARQRTQAKTAKDAADVERKRLAVALGLADDTPPDPAALQSALDARETQLRTLTVERAAERAARQHQADVDALMDSRQFAAALGQLDPGSDTFAADVDQLVKDTVASSPRYRAAPAAPGRSGGPLPGGVPPEAPKDYTNASKADVDKALAAMGIRPRT